MTPLEFDAPTTTTDPEREYSGRQIGRMLHEALQSLNPDYRVVVILRHFHGLSYQEMGEVLGVETKTIKSRLFTARRTLRDLLVRNGLLR
jgi:RNA polymerase sigma-70 factor (ECF subfamily)